ncbi:DUF397 domain-containing protein [Amycolatopsis sp. lyj-112]|uniref:DUF397 domain-containing protein n=1 Tax=Amycolatopsis sp. lyj-112 TaxID=2789288 RepID=UPI00397A87BD
MTNNWHDRMHDWHKSTYTHWEENACVEVGALPGMVGVRDTKQGAIPAETRPILVFPAESFNAFLDHLAR